MFGLSRAGGLIFSCFVFLCFRLCFTCERLGSSRYCCLCSVHVGSCNYCVAVDLLAKGGYPLRRCWRVVLRWCQTVCARVCIVFFSWYSKSVNFGVCSCRQVGPEFLVSLRWPMQHGWITDDAACSVPHQRKRWKSAIELLSRRLFERIV